LFSAIPGLNRVVKVSDYGLVERQREANGGTRTERDKFLLSLPESVQSIRAEYWRLEGINARLRTAAQERRLHDLKGWYNGVYKPMEEEIIHGEERTGRKDTSLRRSLERRSQEYKRR